MHTHKHIIIISLIITTAWACGKKEPVATVDESMAKAIVSNVSGVANVTSAGTQNPITAGMLLQTADVVETAADSNVDLAIKGFGIIKIGANTRIQILELLKSKNGDKAALSIERGDVASFIDRQNPDSEFSVRTPTAVAGVRGTSFIVSVDAKNTKLAVMDGSIYLKQPGQDELILEKNSQVVIEGQNKISKGMIQPLSPDSLEKIKKLSVFHKSNVLEFNTLVEELQKNSPNLQFLEGDADAESEMAKRSQESATDSVSKANRADISKTLKRDTRQDPIKLKSNKSYEQ